MRVPTEIVGYTASGLVLLTFVMKDMRPLRVTAILSNLAFIAYGALHALPPVLCLHLVLLPLNLVRLRQLRRMAAAAARPSERAASASPMPVAFAGVVVERAEPVGAGRWKLTVVIAEGLDGPPRQAEPISVPAGARSPTGCPAEERSQ
jgi:hypothetical protein